MLKTTNGRLRNGQQRLPFDCRQSVTSRPRQRLQNRQCELQSLRQLMDELNVQSATDIETELDRLARRKARFALKRFVGGYVDAEIGEAVTRVLLDHIGTSWADIKIHTTPLRIPVVEFWDLVSTQLEKELETTFS